MSHEGQQFNKLRLILFSSDSQSISANVSIMSSKAQYISKILEIVK